jgi:DHA1 family tetracycline resistance protein-like MFS transporter
MPGEIPAAPGTRASAAFIYFTVTLDMLAVGIILPVLPNLIAGFTHGDTARTAQILGIFGSLFAGMQFFCSPLLGALSDRFGRRPVVLLSNLGLGLDYILLAWAPALWWLLLGRFISGLTASSIPTAMAYLTDVTPPEKRTAAFGTVNAALGVGFILGPALGGLLGDLNPRLPFWVASGLCLLNALYGLLVLPESLPPQHRCPFSWKRANPFGSALALSRKRIDGPFVRMALLLLLGYTAQQSLNVFVIYADYRYHWMLSSVGFYLAAAGLLMGLYSILLLKPAVKILGERGTILAGLSAGVAGMCLLGLANTGWLFCIALPVFSLVSLVWPVAQSAMSNQTAESEQGQLQGAISSINGIASLIGPALFTYIFSQSIGFLPGLTFFVAGGFLLAALFVSW